MTDSPATVLDMFSIRVERDGDAPFLRLPDGQSWTYAEIDARACRLADRLREAGLGNGDIVGLYMWNDPAWFVGMLAIWSIGGVAALCGAISPATEANRRFALVGAKLVVASDDAPVIETETVIRLHRDGTELDHPTPDAASTGAGASSRCAPSPEDPACVFFTSGTTGDAKALVKTHATLVANARRTAGSYASSGSFRPRVAAADTPPALSFHPFGHAASFGRLVFRLYVGRTVVMMRKFEVDAVARLVTQYEIDTLQLTPAMLHMLAFDAGDADLHSLRYVTSGTAPLPIAVRQAFEKRYGVPVLQAYGSTEGGVMALERYDDVIAGRTGPGCVGRITPDSEWRIVDEDGRDVAPGVDGEILGRPDQRRMITEGGETTLPLDEDGWYHTGDVGRVDEHGILYITGRLKEMLIVGGFNVFPAEIEDVLRHAASVRDVVVVSLADDRLGEIPAAGIVWQPSELEARREDDLFHELAELAHDALAAYKVPRRWFAMPSLPLTPLGKLDRKAAEAEAILRAQPLDARRTA